MRDCISSRRLISIQKGLQLVQMNQMQYEKKNTAFDPFEPTTVLNRLRILGKELTFVDRCVIVYLLIN